MIIGIGIPIAQSRMPRMSNLECCSAVDVVRRHGGSMANGITITCKLQPQSDAGQDGWPWRLVAVHRLEPRVEQVAAVDEELHMRCHIVGDGDVGDQAMR